MSGDPGVVMKLIRNNELREQSLIDPVGKFRVCEPQTLIDTDFEYGLQTTKWETLELVNNIPTFYSRDNDESLALSNITTVADSFNVYVHTSNNHNLIVGSPIIVQGVDSFSAEGSYVVNAVINPTQFVYKAKALQTVTGSIFDNISTQIYIGRLYQGTQYNLDALGYIRTDGLNNILVDTLHPHGFSENTSFILSKSVGQKQLIVANSNIDIVDSFSLSNTIPTTSNNILMQTNAYLQDNVIIHKYTGKLTAFVDNTDVNPATNTITCSNHGFLNDDFAMYVPPPLTLSNIDAAFIDEDNGRMPAISTFNVSNSYNYTYDGTATTISTGGNSMFAAGANNAHFFGSSTVPTFAIPYATTNWTSWDSATDYRTFGQTVPFCIMYRHINQTVWYHRIDIPVTGAQAGTIHERSTNNLTFQNLIYCRWNYFGLYNNGARPSFYYLFLSIQATGTNNYANNWIQTATATGTTNSLQYVYGFNSVSSHTTNPAYTIVMLLSRNNGQQITFTDMSNTVIRVCNFFETFTGIMGFYRMPNMHLYNYDNAGDTFLNDGGNNMYDNNRQGNQYFIDGQPLSYRDRLFTTLPNTPGVEYKFISGCQPQIMFSRIFENRTVSYRINDTWNVGSGSTDSYFTENWSEYSWLCRWGYWGLFGRGSRASVYRMFMVFSNWDGSWPNVSAFWNVQSTNRMEFIIQATPWSAATFPTYVLTMLISQPNGSSIGTVQMRELMRMTLRNCEQSIINQTHSWPLGLVKHSQILEYNEYNTIGGLRPMEAYQVNVLNSHQFQLMRIPAWDENARFNVGEIGLNGWSSIWTTTMNIAIDITTNFFNFNLLYDNRSYIRYHINWSNSTNSYNNNSFSSFVIEFVDIDGIVRYSWPGNVQASNSWGRGMAVWFYLRDIGTIGNLTDPVRRFAQLRFRATGGWMTDDSIMVRWNDVIPAFRYAPLSRPILSITQGNTREYVGKHGFMKAYRIHYFANIGNPNSGASYFNVLRKGNDPLLIEANDSMCLFHHPDMMSIETISRNNPNSRVVTPDWNSVRGPGIPRSFTDPNPYPSYDNLKNGNSRRYWIRPNELSVFNNYAAFRLQGINSTSGTQNLLTNHNFNWWPGTSWIVLVRDLTTTNAIVIPNHGIPADTPIQLENVTPSRGIREIPDGTYFVDVPNSSMIRLKTGPGGNAPLDMSAYDAGNIRLFYTIANPSRDTFFVQDHGLFQGTPLTYTAQTSVIHPLVNTTTYFATNVSRDRFSLSATANGTRLNLGGTQLFEDVSNSSSIGTGNIIQTISNVTLNNAGTGTGNTGGFLPPNGQRYLLFNGAGSRQVDSKLLDLRDVSIITIFLIRGTGTNGGDTPEAGEELWVAYSLNSGSSWTDIGIIADTSVASSWTPRTMSVPLAARQNNAMIRIYQKTTSGANNDNYGVQFIRIDNNVSLTPSDIHLFAVGGIGAVDGTYITTAVPQNSSMLTLTAPFNLPPKVIYITPVNVVNFAQNTLYIPNHNMRSGALVRYQNNGNLAIAPLADNVDYFATRIDENHIRLATTFANALASVNLTFTSVGTMGANRHILMDFSVGGEIVSTFNQTVSASNAGIVVTGAQDNNRVPLTQFTSDLRVGNFMNIIVNSPAYDDYIMTALDSGTFTITLRRISDNANTIFFVTGDAVMFAPPNPRLNNTSPSSGNVTGLDPGRIYYASVTGVNTMRLFNSVSDAQTNTNVINVTSWSNGIFTSLRPSTIVTRRITTIRNNRILEVDTPFTFAITNSRFLLSTNLFVKADGFALHRPYDGGVELIPPKNSDSQMIRQTRKYFRYQSGKGIQVSLAVNFSAPVDVDRLSRVGALATLITRRPHRLSAGVNITVEGSTDVDWNGSYNIISVLNDTSFMFILSTIPNTIVAPGNMSFYMNSWDNSFLRCGLFDDQNGMFFEYDGSVLHAVRRNSIQQLSGTCAAVFNTPVITGTGTMFTSQLSVGDMIVMKGMSYKVVSIQSDTRLFVQPVYRGITRDGIIITKTIDLRVPRTLWTIDKCDGSGPTGFQLDIHRIQMAYMDYSWYGAGKVRFGFKDRNGEVRYVHEFIHNNYLNEAYLRSGNLPCRYEVLNRGFPTYTPALMHWGTSVIMDGKFDDDKAYLFTAAGQLLSYAGNDVVTVNSTSSINFNSNFGFMAFNSSIVVYDSGTRTNVVAWSICAPSAEFTKVQNIRSGTPISGSFIQAGTVTVSQPVRYSNVNSNYATVIWISRPPTSSFNLSGSATVGVENETIPSIIPLISIRLAPSVDNSRPGVMGAREIMNRMQLILKNVGILTTHDCEIRMMLNGSIDNRTWQRVTPPSLSQLVYHTRGDSIDFGTQIFNFRIPGGSPDTTGKRTALSSTYDLNELVTLGNSILGGDGIFPDGPDLLTICASVLDLSGITSTTPFTITGRVTWTESQA